jgi:hypothetical protein
MATRERYYRPLLRAAWREVVDWTTGRYFWTAVTAEAFVVVLLWWLGALSVGSSAVLLVVVVLAILIFLRAFLAAPARVHAEDVARIDSLVRDVAVLRADAEAAQRRRTVRQWLLSSVSDLETKFLDVELEGERARRRGEEFYLVRVSGPTEAWLVDVENRLREVGLDAQADQLRSNARAFRSTQDVDEALQEAKKLMSIVTENLRIGFYDAHL